MPSHIIICVFGNNASAEPGAEGLEPIWSREAEEFQVPEPSHVPAEPSSRADLEVEPIRTDEAQIGKPLISVPAWSPQASNNRGPKFLALDSFQRSLIKRIHNNLGHPTSEKLAAHLKRLKFSQEVVDGAGDYTRWFRMEKRRRKQILCATHFHLGRRCMRGTEEAEKLVNETWLNWAGPPEVIVHDLAGEFVSQQWKTCCRMRGFSRLPQQPRGKEEESKDMEEQ